MAQFTLDDSFGYLINRTAQRLKYALQQGFKAKGYDITPEQWAVLNRLWEEEGLSQVELADRTFKDKPNITRMLGVLEKRGFISRQPDDNDQRMIKVYLTDEGRDLKKKLIPIALKTLKKGGRNLADKDIEQLKRTLNTIASNFD